MPYELIYIVSIKNEEKERAALVDKITFLLQDLGAKVTDKKDSGEKKLAYVIKHENFGHYFTICFEAEPIQIKSIEDKIKSFNEILRYQIFKGKKPEIIEEKEEVKEEKKEKVELPISKSPSDLFNDDILEI
jgi:ribosomal protein S6